MANCSSPIKLGHQITIVDNLSRRWIDKKMGADSFTPIASSKIVLLLGKSTQALQLILSQLMWLVKATVLQLFLVR